MLELNQDTQNVEIVSSASRNTFFLIFGVNKNWLSCAWLNHTTISCIFLELLQKPRSVHTLCKPSTTSRLFGPMPSHRGAHASITPHAEASAFIWAKNQDERVSGSGGKDFSVLHVLRATGGMALGSLAWCRPYEQKNRFQESILIVCNIRARRCGDGPGLGCAFLNETLSISLYSLSVPARSFASDNYIIVHTQYRPKLRTANVYTKLYYIV